MRRYAPLLFLLCRCPSRYQSVEHISTDVTLAPEAAVRR